MEDYEIKGRALVMSFQLIIGDFEKSKQCALVSVKELLEVSPSLPILADSGGFGDDINLSTAWWKKVESAIQKL